MDEVRIIEIKKSVFDDNNADADKLRGELKEKGVFLLNLMSSPGSGKTSTLVRTINMIKDKLKVAVMEADIDSDVDAITIKEATGVESIQLHTGGMCHLDAEMTRQGLDNLPLSDIDLALLGVYVQLDAGNVLQDLLGLPVLADECTDPVGGYSDGSHSSSSPSSSSSSLPLSVSSRTVASSMTSAPLFLKNLFMLRMSLSRSSFAL